MPSKIDEGALGVGGLLQEGLVSLLGLVLRHIGEQGHQKGLFERAKRFGHQLGVAHRDPQLGLAREMLALIHPKDEGDPVWTDAIGGWGDGWSYGQRSKEQGKNRGKTAAMHIHTTVDTVSGHSVG